MKLRQTIILLSFGLVPAASMADLSANVGMVSDYLYRGIYQEDSSASAGLDYEHDSGFYVGTWGADVGDGIETDLYFGYGGEVGDITWGVGYTGYYYTDTFDDTYAEINLGVGYGIFSLDFASGEWDGFGLPQDYTFTSLTLEIPNGPYFTYGDFGDQFTGFGRVFRFLDKAWRTGNPEVPGARIMAKTGGQKVRDSFKTRNKKLFGTLVVNKPRGYFKLKP